MTPATRPRVWSTTSRAEATVITSADLLRCVRVTAARATAGVRRTVRINVLQPEGIEPAPKSASKVDHMPLNHP